MTSQKQDSLLSLHYLKKLKLIKEVCKENATEFKYITKFSLNLLAFS